MGNQSILIINGDQDQAELLKSTLEKAGYAVITAQNGSLGLKLARFEKPHLVILDMDSLDINGLDVCQALHVEFNMPMLVLSAKYGEIDKVLAIELGADDYVTKPFSIRELVLRIRSVLNRSYGIHSR